MPAPLELQPKTAIAMIRLVSGAPLVRLVLPGDPAQQSRSNNQAFLR